MAGLLPRRKPVCFYCGCRSAQKLKTPIRQWACEKCEAVNYLDEVGNLTNMIQPDTHCLHDLLQNGDIADPPTSATATTVQYAVPIPRASSPLPSTAGGDAIFCATCQKNQHLLAETLASYLPPADHPDYPEYEAAYPAYRDGLEDRYPQVCEDCEPRVRERIKAAGYYAKTEGMKRMLERTRMRNAEGVRATSGWLLMTVMLGRWMWWASLLTQLAWSSANIIAPQGSCGESTSSNPILSTVCTLQPSLRRYTSVLDDVGRYAHILGLLSIWYHHRLTHQVTGAAGRVVGLSEYYQMQVLALAVRGGIWWFLDKDGSRTIDPSLHCGLHLFILGFVIITTGISRRLLRINYSPRISLQEEIKPLRVGPSTMATQHQQHIPEPFYSVGPATTAPRNGLSDAECLQYDQIRSSPATPRPFPHNAGPPTPPESVDEDAMDWTPTRVFRVPPPPAPPLAPAIEPAGPTASFSGFQRLPPAPKSLAARLRNPSDTTPFFKAADETKRQTLFQGANGSATQANHEQQTRNDFELAPPKFFPDVTRQSETGLEGLFDATFRLDEEPAEIVRRREQSQMNATTNLEWRSVISKLVSIVFVIGALIAWRFPVHDQATNRKIQFGIIATTGAIVAINLIGVLRGMIARLTVSESCQGPVVSSSADLAPTTMGSDVREQQANNLSPPHARRRARESLVPSGSLSSLSLG